MSDYKRIPLSRGLFTTVDAVDHQHLSRWTWHAAKGGEGGFYAMRVFYPNGKHGPRIKVRMHRSIMDASPDEVVDHRDGDTLNNRRYNLRKCTQLQNTYNCTSRIGTSQYKGVAWHKQAGKWRSYIAVNRKQTHLGLFTDEEAAARAYDTAARTYFGEFARLNFPQSLL